MLLQWSVQGKGSPSVGKVGLHKGNGSGVVVDLDLVEPVEDDETAAALDVVVPGAARLYGATKAARAASNVASGTSGAAAASEAASKGGTFGKVTVRPDLPHTKLSLADSVELVGVEVARVTVLATPKSCSVTTRCRVEGVEPSTITALVGLLGERVEATVDPMQLDMFSATRAYRIGDVVVGTVGAEAYAGRIVATSLTDDGDVVEIDDFGTMFTVPYASILDSFPHSVDAASYESVARDIRRVPTWRALIEALGARWLGSDGPWVVDPVVVEHATRLSPEATKPKRRARVVDVPEVL